MLSVVFKFPLPEISTSPILKDLIRSFEISSPRPLFPPLLGIWIRFWSISQVRHLSPLQKHLFWTKPRRPCSFSPWLLPNGFRSSRPCHSLCRSRVRTWSYIMTRSSVLRRSLPPILCLVLSLFRLFRTLLVTCPRGSSALSERLSSSGKLLDQPPIFRPGFSSLLGIRNVPCRRMPFRFIFDS